jgi:hypothetical protein
MVSKGKIRSMGDQFITFFRRDIGGKKSGIKVAHDSLLRDKIAGFTVPAL